jgi:hypothetical protein
MIRDHLLAGKLELLPDHLLNESLDDEIRASRGRIHPIFMGGECLPDYGGGEVEIARIELKSTTYDVISLRARPSRSELDFWMVKNFA